MLLPLHTFCGQQYYIKEVNGRGRTISKFMNLLKVKLLKLYLGEHMVNTEIKRDSIVPILKSQLHNRHFLKKRITDQPISYMPKQNRGLSPKTIVFRSYFRYNHSLYHLSPLRRYSRVNCSIKEGHYKKTPTFILRQ